MPLGERVRHDLGVTCGACKTGGLFFCCPQVEVDKDISIRTSLEFNPLLGPSRRCVV